MTDGLASEKMACLEVLATVATLNGDPTPHEFEAFMAAINTFQPLPHGVTPERLLASPPALDVHLQQIQTPELQQQVYRSACTISRSQGIDLQEAALLSKLADTFQFSPKLAHALSKQPLATAQTGSLMNSALAGITTLIGREGDVRRLIFDYSLGAAIVGLIPITGGGAFELKLLVMLGLMLKMSWDIGQLWGKPQGQDWLAIIGSVFGFLSAVLMGILAWTMMVALGVVIPYLGAFDKAVGFAVTMWIVGQSTSQFYTSLKRPDLTALKRAFPHLMPTEPSTLPTRSHDHGQV